MKKIFFIFLLVLMVACKQKTEIYSPKFVFDTEQALTPQQVKLIDKLFIKHEKKTSNEIVLITTQDYDDNDNINLYSVDYLAKHLVGKKEKENGILIVFSKQQSEVRITPVKGLENIFEDGTTKYIIDSVMIPKFEEKQYFEGLLAGSKEIIKYLEK